MDGLQYEKSSFQVGGRGGTDVVLHQRPEAEIEERRLQTLSDQKRINEELAIAKKNVKKKKIIPYGNRILVKRRGIGEKLGTGIIIASDETKERLTEIADVVYVPDQTFCDKELIKNSDKIITALMGKALEGNPSAAQALFDFNEYLRIKTLKAGDVLMVGKYVGTDFSISETGESLSMLTPEGIIGLVVEI